MAFQRFFMKTLKIILPDQLSENNPIYSDLNNDDYLMFYEPLDTFFEINHHKQKIVFLISSFRKIINNNSHKNIIHRKITKNSKENLNSFLNNINQEHKFQKIVISKPSDFDVYKNLMFFCQSNDIVLEVLDDVKFISETDDFTDWASDKKTRIQEYYYRWLRKKYNIFMNEDSKPVGDKWNFDKDNRKGISHLKDEIPKRKTIKADQGYF